ncbi:MAG: DUF4339 domain-containing protein [Planctomycetes bacterium]|nr:DUF4339 domain-containing protein [Planctomycetota bacterium]
MANQWYFQRSGETFGPISTDRLRELAADGQIAPTDKVIGDGMSDWVPAESLDVVDFKSAAPVPRIVARNKHSSAPVTRPTRPNDNRQTLWICVAVAVVVFAGAIGWVASSAFNSGNDKENRIAGKGSPAKSKHFEKTKTADRPVDPKPNPTSAAGKNATDRETRESNLDDLFDTPAPITDPTSPGTGTSIYEPLSPPVVSTETKSQPETADDPDTPPTEPITKPKEPPTEPITKPKKPPTEPITKPKEPPKTTTETRKPPVTLFQELDVIRNPRFVVQGLPIEQQIKYRMLSQLQVSEPDADGIRRVAQVVLDTKLDKADELSRAIFQESLLALRGHQFSFKLNRLHEVFDFRGHKDNKKAKKVDVLGGQGFLVSSVMDKDGWTELAQLSFFLPRPQARIGETWRGQMAHDWGPLGSWSGSTTYKLKSRQDDIIQVDYAYEMVYSPPAKGRRDLPFQINSARFTPVAAGGAIQYSDRQKRVTVAVERFHVQGVLETVVLGQVARIQIEEKQAIQVRLFDQNPWKQ